MDLRLTLFSRRRAHVPTHPVPVLQMCLLKGYSRSRRFFNLRFACHKPAGWRRNVEPAQPLRCTLIIFNTRELCKYADNQRLARNESTTKSTNVFNIDFFLLVTPQLLPLRLKHRMRLFGSSHLRTTIYRSPGSDFGRLGPNLKFGHAIFDICERTDK